MAENPIRPAIWPALPVAGFDLSGAGGVDGINLMLYLTTLFKVRLSSSGKARFRFNRKKSGKLSLYDYIDTEVVVSLVELYPACSDKTWLYCFAMVERRTGAVINPKALTREQAQVLEGLSKRINISVDKKDRCDYRLVHDAGSRGCSRCHGFDGS